MVGLSGGKDSAVVAALCARALGADRVIGVMMPNLTMPDMDDAVELAEHLGIRTVTVPITTASASISVEMQTAGVEPSVQAAINLPARLRMAALYAVSQSMNGRVANTCNYSEEFIGYSTRWGDAVGDFCPIADLVTAEVRSIGIALGLPAHLVDKVPSDGLCGKTDEENLGFTYDVLDRYILTGECDDEQVREKIEELHAKNLFKQSMPPRYEWGALH